MSSVRRLPSRTFRRRAGAFAAALALVGTLAACDSGAGSPGAAAYVGNMQISETEVTRVADQWAELTGQVLPRAQVVDGLATAELVNGTAAQLDVHVPQDVLAGELQTLIATSGADLTPERVEPGIAALIESTLITNELQQPGNEELLEAVITLIQDTKYQVNPRYVVVEDGGYYFPTPIGDSFLSSSNG